MYLKLMMQKDRHTVFETLLSVAEKYNKPVSFIQEKVLMMFLK